MIKISSASETKGLSLTIYNGGFGAVKEVRRLKLSGEETEVVFADVAQLIETDSLLVEGLPAAVGGSRREVRAGGRSDRSKDIIIKKE